MKHSKNQSLEESREDIINRLRTIRGHIAGIEKMIEEGKNCDEVLAQVVAAKSSIHKVGLLIVENHAHDCLRKPNGDDKVDLERVEEILQMVLNSSK